MCEDIHIFLLFSFKKINSIKPDQTSIPFHRSGSGYMSVGSSLGWATPELRLLRQSMGLKLSHTWSGPIRDAGDGFVSDGSD